MKIPTANGLTYFFSGKLYSHPVLSHSRMGTEKGGCKLALKKKNSLKFGFAVTYFINLQNLSKSFWYFLKLYYENCRCFPL